MKINLTGRHFEITPHLKAHIGDKVSKLDRFNDHIIEGSIILFRDSIKDIAEGKILLGHATLTAKGEGEDMYIAVNDLVDKLLTQMQRHEGRLRSRKRGTPPERIGE
jgi:putative sigma-54 modulation protein